MVRLRKAVYCRLAPGTPEPEELVAEVALRLLERGRTIESANGTLVRWVLIDALNKRGKTTRHELSTDISLLPRVAAPLRTGPAATTLARRRRRRIVQAIAGLSTSIRRVFVLRLFAGMTQREIARRLDISLATVHRRLKAATAEVTRTVDIRLNTQTRMTRARPRHRGTSNYRVGT